MSVYTSKLALLGNIVDYAGTFPPAALSLTEALKQGASFRRRGTHAWLLAKYALKTSDILKLTPRVLFEAGADGTPWIFAALGTPCQSAGEYLATVQRDVQALAEFSARYRESGLSCEVMVYETKPPAEVSPSVFSDVCRALGPLPFGPKQFYFELGLQDRLAFEAAVRSLGDAMQKNPALKLGWKVRTGGESVPEASELAHGIRWAADAGVRFKATQGLHRPVTQGSSYGFVNLFTTLALAYSDPKASAAELSACLQELEREAFQFAPHALRWRNRELPLDQIEKARAVHAGCFGSCSIDEPDEFLRDYFADGNEKENR